MRRKKEHSLAGDDRILWEKVARTVTPLGPARLILEEEAPVEFKIMLDQPKPAAILPVKAKPKPKTLATFEPIDEPIQRRIAKGKLAIEARIDLHGLTQDEAHGLLLSFIARAAQRHLRTVLIITGKGRSPKSEGALKRAVPLWLAQPAFAMHVSGTADAAQSHGGEGALYVRLRKPVGLNT
ncbi:MAG: Smr/MutS family protein [Notoacmeibacter sp.]